MGKKRFITVLLSVLLAVGSTFAQQKIVFVPNWTAQAQFAGFYVADALGFYKEAGLDVVIRHPTTSQNSFEWLKSGECQFASLQLVSAITFMSRGGKAVNVLQYFQQNGQMIISHKPLKGLNSLNGMRIGRFLSGASLLPLAVVNKHQLQVEWIPFLSQTNLFISGAIDATLAMNYNEYYQLLNAGQRLQPSQLLYMRDVGYNVPDDGLYVSADFYRAHPAEVKKFVEATKKGWEWAVAHPKETVDYVMFYVRQNGVASNAKTQTWMLNECLKLLKHPKTGKRTYRLDTQAVDQVNRILLEGGVIKRAIPYQQLTKP